MQQTGLITQRNLLHLFVQFIKKKELMFSTFMNLTLPIMKRFALLSSNEQFLFLYSFCVLFVWPGIFFFASSLSPSCMVDGGFALNVACIQLHCILCLRYVHIYLYERQGHERNDMNMGDK